MGLGGIFGKNANFNGMIESNGKPFKTSDVIHKTIIKVNEGGPPGSQEQTNKCKFLV